MKETEEGCRLTGSVSQGNMTETHQHRDHAVENMRLSWSWSPPGPGGRLLFAAVSDATLPTVRAVAG